MELYDHICKKYPDVLPVDGEDLNLDRMYAKTIYACWLNTTAYPTVLDIALALGRTDRQVYRIAKANKFPNRRRS